MIKFKIIIINIIYLFISFNLKADEHDYLRIVGSSTVYPFITITAEVYSEKYHQKTPIVESTGTGGGVNLFCSSKTKDHPDIVTASRPIKDSERKKCASNGIEDIKEIKLGLDGIIIAKSKYKQFDNISIKDLFLALAKYVPSKEGDIIVNPYKKWNEINDKLPNEKIEVYGPASTSGTRDAFYELVMQKACVTFQEYKKHYDKNILKVLCNQIRDDGAYIEVGENENLVINKITSNKNSIGIIGFSFLEQNSDIINAVAIDNILPDLNNITKKTYPLARFLYLYLDNQALLSSNKMLKDFVKEATSDEAIGENGYLTKNGLVPVYE